MISFDWENISVEALRAATRGTHAHRAAAAGAGRRAGSSGREAHLRAPGDPHHALRARSTRCSRSSARIARIGLPGVLKTRRLGYDGKGQYVLRSGRGSSIAPGQRSAACRCSTRSSCRSSTRCRSSACADAHGEIGIYPLNRNYHADGILRLTLAPWQAPRLLRAAHVQPAARARDFSYVGVLTHRVLRASRTTDRQ